MFMTFVAGLLGDFRPLPRAREVDLLRDGVSYRLAGLWLDDAEFAELRASWRPCWHRGWRAAGPGRRRRILASVLPPEAARNRSPRNERRNRDEPNAARLTRRTSAGGGRHHRRSHPRDTAAAPQRLQARQRHDRALPRRHLFTTIWVPSPPSRRSASAGGESSAARGQPLDPRAPGQESELSQDDLASARAARDIRVP